MNVTPQSIKQLQRELDLARSAGGEEQQLTEVPLVEIGVETLHFCFMATPPDSFPSAAILSDQGLISAH